MLLGAELPPADVDRRSLTSYERSDSCDLLEDAMTQPLTPRLCIGLPVYTGARYLAQAIV